MNNNAKKFKIGRVLNPPVMSRPTILYKKIVLLYPARLNAMALDPSKIAVNISGVYSPGEIIFSVEIFKKVSIQARKDRRIFIKTTSKRPRLLLHAARLMQKALRVKHGFDISVEVGEELRHCGLGSSSGLIASVAVGINELYGNPIKACTLMAYLAQNHGEEIDGDSKCLQRVQCIGGSAAAGLVKAGMIILSGVAVPVVTMNISDEYKVVIGIPKDFQAPDAKALMKLEIENMHKFIKTGKEYGPMIGYRILHETLPAMATGELEKASRIIFDYRFNYGSIRNCSFVYPRITAIASRVRHLFEDDKADTLALSSVGPAFFAITKQPKVCIQEFEKAGMRVFLTKINNSGYKVLRRQKA